MNKTQAKQNQRPPFVYCLSILDLLPVVKRLLLSGTLRKTRRQRQRERHQKNWFNE